MYISYSKCNFSTCVQNSSNEDSHLRESTVPKDLHYPQERTFPWHTIATCPECAPIRLVPYRPSCLTPLLYTNRARNRKVWWKTRFRCYLRFPAQRTYSQDGLLRDSYASKDTHCSMTNVQNVHCIASSTVVYHHCSLSCSNLRPYEYTSGKQNTRKVARYRWYLKLCAHWTLKQEVMVMELCGNSCYAQETKFSWHKSLNCPECAQLSLVYCSVQETCAEVFLLHCSVAFCSPYIPGRKKIINTINMTFSVYFPYLCAEFLEPRFACKLANCT